MAVATDSSDSADKDAAPNAKSEATAKASDARALMRVGWMMAETHGRYRLGDDARFRVTAGGEHQGAVLPLALERPPAEQRIESEKVLAAMVSEQGLDLPITELGFDPAQFPAAGTTAIQLMKWLALELAAVRKRGDTPAAQDVLAELSKLFYRWDMHIQDSLAAGPYGRASAYQLGRGVAEVYWSLDPDADADRLDSWHHLLVERFNALAALLRRSAALLPELTAETVTATLEQWRGVATEFGSAPQAGIRRQVVRQNVEREEATRVLGLQAGLWRDLLLSGSKPTALIATDQTWLRARSLGPLIRSFAAEATGLLVGLLLVGTAIVFVTLGAPGIQKALGGTLAAVLGAFGLTWSTFVARAKAVGQGLLTQLHSKITADAVIAAATYLPESYARRNKSVRQSASAQSARHLGPVMTYTTRPSQ